MTGLLLALLATLVVGLGARDQMLVAQLSDRQGARPSLLLVAIASGLVSSAIAAWGGAQAAGMMPGNARLFLVALALGLAGLELLALSPRPAPAEPTHSLGAFALVILSIQLTDAARFVVFALSALTRAPLTTGMGGAAGAAFVVGLGWMVLGGQRPGWFSKVRRGVGGAILLLALAMGMRAIGVL